MIKRTNETSDSIKVTFVVDVAECNRAVSVVGDFNQWDPLSTPLRKRSNGTRSASLDLPRGASYRFKYLAEDGEWFCDSQADDHVANDYASVDSLIVV